MAILCCYYCFCSQKAGSIPAIYFTRTIFQLLAEII
jgi:hypothetical protein